MSIQRTRTAAIEAASDVAAIQEAVRVLEDLHTRKMAVQRWVCEVCGMIHTGSAPRACESCGSATSIVHLTDFRTEIGSRW
jgi:rubrerythrin